jgi:hypothetical protein
MPGYSGLFGKISTTVGPGLKLVSAWRNRFLSYATPRAGGNKITTMKTTKLLLTAVIGAGLAFGVSAQAKEQMGEKVELNSLPAAVQQTIREKAAGGEIVHVKREDDTNGKWNYEVVVKTNGKEWGFEVDPNGKFLKKHGETKE